ncbi:MAG: DNA (cytosine-5-)-methyltransferase [Mycoplasma sp.]
MNRSSKISNNLFDVTKVKGIDVPKDIDIFTYSFPCQDISNQGLQLGFVKGTKSRSGLLWEIDRILTEIHELGNQHSLPKFLLLENVKAMVNKNHKAAYVEWLKRLDELGYVSQEYILNSIDFGSPQSRERVFVLSVLKSHQKNVNFEFPKFEKQNKKKSNIKTIIDETDKSNQTKFLDYKLIEKNLTKTNIKKFYLENYTNFASEAHVYDINYSGPTLTASGALSRIKFMYERDYQKIIREINPNEAFRYMGFTDRDYKNVCNTELITATKQIYLCGNSISVEVLESLFESLVF